MTNVKQKFVYTENVNATKEWYDFANTKDSLLKCLQVKKDYFTILETGERIEMHRFLAILPNKRGTKELLYLIKGENVPTQVFKFINDEGKKVKYDTIKKRANKTFSAVLLQRLKELESEVTIVDEDDEELLDLE